MFFLHAIWTPPPATRFHLWMEATHFYSPPSMGKDSQYRSDEIGKTPLALPQPLLAEPLVGAGLPDGSWEEDEVTLLLPSYSTTPLPSDSPPDELGSDLVSLYPWIIPTYALDPATALDFLVQLPDEFPSSLHTTATLRYWRHLAQLVAQILAAGSYVPYLELDRQPGNRPLLARWKAILPNENLLGQLVAALPPATQAFPSAALGRGLDRENLVHSFIQSAVDSAIRREIKGPSRGRGKTSLAHRWLQSLSGDNGELSRTTSGDHLAEDLSNLFSPLLEPLSEPGFRTCFRLEEPPEGKKNPWKLTFWLQARADKTILLPAEKVWQNHPTLLPYLQDRFEDPQPRLLADLGRAAQTYPDLEMALQTKEPTHHKLDLEEAYRFLEHFAPLLKREGFGLLLPGWWKKRRLGVKLKVSSGKATAVSSGLLSSDNLLNYKWELALGETTLTKEDLDKLSDLKLPLVRMRGEWMELRGKDMKRALQFLHRGETGEISPGEALRLTWEQDPVFEGLPLVGFEGDSWMEELTRKLERDQKLTPVDQPESFSGEMRPYQLVGLSWLTFCTDLGLGVCLADDMGLGKTIQLIAWLLHERREEGADPPPTLLICPTSVLGNWEKEIQRFAPSLQVLVHHGPQRFQGDDFPYMADTSDIVLTTYALAQRDEETLMQLVWRAVVLDEAQNIKNPRSKQTLAVKNLVAQCRLALTGTPLENRLSELWSIIDFLNPGYLDTEADFHRTFTLPIEKHHKKAPARRLRRLTKPLILRRVKTDPTIIQDLPDKIETKVYCPLTEEQATLYQAVVKDFIEQINQSSGMKRRGLVLAALTKLKQVCNHPAQFLHDGSDLAGRSGKLIRLSEMVEEAVDEGHKMLVYTQYKEMGDLIERHMKESMDLNPLFLHGQTPAKRRQKFIELFQEQSDHRVFILSLKAGGLGLNLTAASHVFHYDRWWNPAVEDQATDRAYRIGQDKNVHVHKFICLGTLEEQIDVMIEEKKDLADRIVGTSDKWVTELSTEELQELFRLRKVAIYDDE